MKCAFIVHVIAGTDRKDLHTQTVQWRSVGKLQANSALTCTYGNLYYICSSIYPLIEIQRD